jgi:hypothetical protein
MAFDHKDYDMNSDVPFIKIAPSEVSSGSRVRSRRRIGNCGS